MKKVISLLLVLVLVCSFAGCMKTEKQNNKLSIIATLFPQYDFCREIAGDKADVTLLLPPGSESHSFEPTTSDVMKINQADAFIYTGDNMEAWAKQIIESVQNENLTVLDISDKITMINSEDEHGHHENEIDPHIWTSPVNAQIIVNEIADMLIKIDSANSDYYRKNADNYIVKLKNLDKQIREVVANGKRKEVIFGGRCALLYFLKEYDLEFMSAYDSCSMDADPSASTLKEITDRIKANKIPVIYYEELSDPKVGRALAKETGTELLLFHSAHNVSKEDFDKGVSYLSIMEQNVENLRKGLS